MQDLFEIVKDHFNRYSNTDVVYESGGVLYLTHAAAESYGTGCIRTIKRSEIGKLAPQEEKKPNRTEEINVEAMSYQEMKSKVAELGLVVADKKSITLKAALVAFYKKED